MADDCSVDRNGRRRRRRSFRENCAQGGLELDQVILALVTEAEAAIDASVRPPWADPAVLRGPPTGVAVASGSDVGSGLADEAGHRTPP